MELSNAINAIAMSKLAICNLKKALDDLGVELPDGGSELENLLDLLNELDEDIREHIAEDSDDDDDEDMEVLPPPPKTPKIGNSSSLPDLNWESKLSPSDKKMIEKDKKSVQ